MSALRTTFTRSLRGYLTLVPLSPCPSCIVSSSKVLLSSHAPATPSSSRLIHSSSSTLAPTSGLINPVRSASTAASAGTAAASASVPPLGTAPPVVVASRGTTASTKKRAVPKARKAAISLTPEAVTRIRSLLSSPEPKLIRIGVRNKGCAGMSYHLEYVDQPARFDEVVEQDGVKVVVDSRALFSVIGSEMDWQEDALQAKFVFKNPNIKDACGCGESFIV